jgi:predicted metal-binding membrane protein
MAPMGGMAMVGAGLFLVTWVVMMTAMMFPSAAPMLLTHARVVRSRGEGTVPTVSFVAGYLVVWMVAGLVPLGVIQLLGASIARPISGWLPPLGGAVIVVAGAYQLTPLKNACLQACRSPLGFIRAHDVGGGNSAAARAGTIYGVYCLGSCCGLLAILAVLGLMNLAWMAIFSAVFFLEKTWRHGVMLSRIVGAACVILGLAVTIRPEALHLIGGPMAGG